MCIFQLYTVGVYLLYCFRVMEKYFSSGKFSQKKFEKELPRSSLEKKLCHWAPRLYAEITYKSIKDHNSEFGNDRRSWQYFELHLPLVFHQNN
ncbi:hypothetical protein WA026_018957 [Henosepilachna vigintioctopunctata]|uniref:Uncharacterized protein n=1 Tax=Henosepilachna vigintioctopunctata TaxID=420089 RepID=A0AAW1UEL5_9CUCU